MTRIRFDFPPDTAGPAVYTDPVRTIRADTTDQVIPALEAVQAATAGGLHAAGFLTYEAAPAFDPAMVTTPLRESGQPDPLPLVWFGLFDGLSGRGAAEEDGEAQRSGGATDWVLETDRETHAAAVRRIHAAIAEGRTYQVNLTTRMRARFAGDAEAFYHRLRRAQGDGYHALLDLGRHVIVSASPELFFQTRGREITTRPMKGTRPRGRWPDEDRALLDALRTSPKDRAENLMIVDLLRNDVGRVSVPGGVRVPALRDVERYRTVWQMTSTITGTLRDDVGLVDLFRALFPCGSVTGAPKISTMKLIADLETSPRDVYCGAIGRILPGGDCTFNVPIRTAWIDRRRSLITYGTGGGVVWDSTADGEYDELMAKTAVVHEPWPAFQLLETLAVENGRAVRLHRHLQRMAISAERFDFPFPEDDVRAAVRRAARERSGRSLLRVTVGLDGSVDADTRPLDTPRLPGPTPADPVRNGTPGEGVAAEPEDAGVVEPRVVVYARSPVDTSSPFLYHKTTHRAVYDRHLADAGGEAFDVLLHNERGEVTEFCRGNLVAEIDGRLLTPPRSAGLLPGCFRAQLLEEGHVAEATLTPDHLARATRLWFVNSARGWIPVRLRAP
ncbi:MAG: aminodeoxychorismate synthase component I [Longimicrobiales bacterium]